ncbi:hypothetical protein LJR251_003459 [Rhizobium rhizogenes]|uniref:hypothetical protein n=1 Tax=Rhizobium rhizogenes TaxID=359 RepID=UPI003ED094DC
MSANRTTKTASPAFLAYDYEKEGIEPSRRDQLETSASYIFDLGRRTTEQTFELGDHLASAAELLADGTFDRWVKKRCGLAARSARNYMGVFRNLAPYRDDLVDLSVGSTVLFHLSSATPDQIRTAITFAEDNGRIQVSDVKAILADGEEGEAAQGDQYRVGGVVGLKALIAIKIREGLKAFIAHVAMICQAVDAALAKGRVIKEALAKEIQDIARVARQELDSLALFIEPELDWGRNTRPTKFPKASGWAEVNDTLYRLGGVDGWPKSKEMRDWLGLHVLPVLDWAVSKERMPEWPLATAEVATYKPVASAEDTIEVDEQGVASEASGDISDAADGSKEGTERFGRALEEATGGFMTVSRETSRTRKQVAEVPPLAGDEAVELEPALAVVR